MVGLIEGVYDRDRGDLHLCWLSEPYGGLGSHFQWPPSLKVVFLCK